ncbi:MAG TPA: glycoside hydrolase [Bacteroides sp.]|nr:glycoside hydrolase [Bacteroides sp.]
MMIRNLIPFFLLCVPVLYGQQQLQLNEQGYFHKDGLDVTVFSDYYPEGHQSGVTIIQHGNRVAANGDLRLEPSPGQWSPIPAAGIRTTDSEGREITQTMWYPDSSKNRTGFNPILYPDLTFSYRIRVSALGQNSFRITVDLEEPLPEEWTGKAGFNLELFPGDLFGKGFLMDGAPGIFPYQPAGPMEQYDGEPLNEPLGRGTTLVIAPEEPLQRMVIRSEGALLELRDGRSNHNNGWFIVRSSVPEGATESAITWTVTPGVVENWQYEPVIQVSQLGYHPGQKKRAVIELDRREQEVPGFELFRLETEGRKLVFSGQAASWGRFLRYRYVTLDFSEITEPGLYQLACMGQHSHPFRIAEDVYRRHTWQPTLEYYLPVQMCHMRVNEKYRVWHDLCHADDALMAPADTNHFDGYLQGPENYTPYEPLQPVPGLNRGGWHDAGDYDLRVESQAGTVWMLALMIEEFGLDHDATLIDQANRIVEIHVPDGRPDAIQQIEHGLEAILGGYRSLGRLYRGIICSDLRQYVMLGDAAAMTDNVPGTADDRWVFTEKNPRRELEVAAALAAAARVLKPSGQLLAAECLETALALWSSASAIKGNESAKVAALSELILTTGDPGLKKALADMKDYITGHIDRCGWAVGHVIHEMEDPAFRDDVAAAVKTYQEQLQHEQRADSPYGVPYRPNIWGAGWNIQRFGVEQYFFHKGWPDLVSTGFTENSLHFILGVHPGSNNASFASGVGSKSVRVAYGVNRADWSFIPGGVVSGTALIRPDLPELKTWPYLWQQTEYVMGGGATNYMFLVLAVNSFYSKPETAHAHD